MIRNFARATYVIALLVLFPALARAACVYEKDVTYVDWFDASGYHSYTVVSLTLLYCDEDGGGGGGGLPGGGGGSTGGGPLPYVNITAVSDQNPHQLRCDISSVYGVTMTLYKDGSIVSQGPPASFGFFGSLDNMVAASTTLAVEVCNDNGCATDEAFVYRHSETRAAEGAIQAWYNVILPDPETGFKFEHRAVTYSRKLRVEFYYADYSVGTTGSRNGRVQHIRSTDSLLWTDATSPPPTWVTAYRMTPYWAGQQIRDEAAGCYAPDPSYPYSDSQCTTIAEFALDGTTEGEGVIEAVSGVSSVPETLPPFGALDLVVVP